MMKKTLTLCAALVLGMGATAWAQKGNKAQDANAALYTSRTPTADISQCTTIDKNVTELCRQMLAQGIEKGLAKEGQIAVVDAKTGHLKAWVAMKLEDGKAVETALTKRRFSSAALLPMMTVMMAKKEKLEFSDSIDVENGVYKVNDKLTIRDHNWRSGGYGKMSILDVITKHSNVASFKLLEKASSKKRAAYIWRNLIYAENTTNAMKQAAMFNAFCSVCPIRMPMLVGDSVSVVDMSENDKRGYTLFQSVLTKMNEGDALQAKYAPNGVKISGAYAIAPKEKNSGREFSFAGAFPAGQPRYAICVFVDVPQDGEAHSLRDLANIVVNPIVEQLAATEK